MIYVRSIIFNIFLYLGTLIWTVLLLPAIFLSKSFAKKVPGLWGMFISKSLKYAAGIDYKIQGRENIPHNLSNNPVIFAIKHQSAWETIIFTYLIPKSVFIFKKELIIICGGKLL